MLIFHRGKRPLPCSMHNAEGNDYLVSSHYREFLSEKIEIFFCIIHNDITNKNY